MDERRDDVERTVALGELGLRLAPLRLREPSAIRALQCSLARHGQLTAVTAFRERSGGLELLDGFKRLEAGRALRWLELRVRMLPLDGVQAKAAVAALNRGGGLTELEEGWLVRSLYRDDGLTQPQIGVLLERHKSWVSRRLMLVEQLDESVQGDVRLGLLGARAAATIARLPRDNQAGAAEVVARRGLTTRQCDRLVAELLSVAGGEAGRRKVLADWHSGRAGPSAAAGAVRPQPTPAAALLADIGQLCRTAARLQARLLERPLDTLGAAGADAVRAGLASLHPVLEGLHAAVSPLAFTQETR